MSIQSMSGPAGEEDDEFYEEALVMAFTGLVQAVAAKDHRTARRLTRELRKHRWSCVPLGPQPEGGGK